MRLLFVALALAALAAVVFSVGGAGAVSAQESTECEATDLGSIGTESENGLETTGSWTTEDCESSFRAGSDAHTYRFEVLEAGRIRVDLTSDEGDSFLYLMSEDGRRIIDNDDGGAGLDARVERDLTPGVYQVEATTVGGRGRGQADFTLSVSYVEGCDTIHLGTLEPDMELTDEGSWSLDTCGSTFVVAHPAYRYSFNLPQDGRVRIDLESEHGDAVLSLASTTSIIAANDDGGERRNSRIEQYLQAGVYLIEATTYLQRALQPLIADFTLTAGLVDEDARLDAFQLKIEETHAPDVVYAGVPFPVHYRVGNVGLGDLAQVQAENPVELKDQCQRVMYGKLRAGHVPGQSQRPGNVEVVFNSFPELLTPLRNFVRRPGFASLVLPYPYPVAQVGQGFFGGSEGVEGEVHPVPVPDGHAQVAEG